MQAVILAGGKGVRLRPLTNKKPKPMVLVNEKPILEYIFEALPSKISEIIIVTGAFEDKIKEYFGENWKNIPIHYISQKDGAGTAPALRTAQSILHDSFLVLPGDDIHIGDALSRLVEQKLAILVSESEHPENFGVVAINKDNTFQKIIEKPENPPTNLVSTGAFVLDSRIFNYSAEPDKKNEELLPDLVNQFASSASISIVRTDKWFPIGYPEDVKKTEKLLL